MALNIANVEREEEKYGAVRAAARAYTQAVIRTKAFRETNLRTIQEYEALLQERMKAEEVLKEIAKESLPAGKTIIEEGQPVTYTPILICDADALVALCPEAAQIEGLIKTTKSVDSKILEVAIEAGLIPREVVEKTKTKFFQRKVDLR